MVRTSGFLGLLAVTLAVTSSLSVSAQAQEISTLRSLAATTKSSQSKYTAGTVSAYEDASESAAASGAEEPVDSPPDEELTESSTEEPVDYEALFAELTASSAGGEVTDSSGAEEPTEAPAEEELVDGSAALSVDSTAASSEEEPVESSTEEGSVDYETLFAELTASSTGSEVTDASAEAEESAAEEVTDTSALVDSTASSGEQELVDSSGDEELTEAASTDEEETTTLVDSTASSEEAESTDPYTEEEAVDTSALTDSTASSGDEELTDAAALTESTDSPGQEDPADTVAPPATAKTPATKMSAPVTKTPAPANKTSPSVTKAPAAKVPVTPAPAAKVPATPAPVTKAPGKPYSPPPVVASLPNWIGTRTPTDKACYRKTHLTKKCPPGYEFDKIATCWAECPVEYPVECGMECIPQNKDCALAVLDKVNAVATVALNAATSGVFGKLVTASKGVQRGVKCGQQLYSATNKVVGYAKELGVKFPNTTKSQIQYLLSKSDFALYDLPMAVTTCLGLPMPTSLTNSPEVTAVIKKLLEKVTVKGESLLAPSSFIEVTEEVGAGQSVTQLNSVDLSSLTKLMDSGVTCGSELNSIINRVTMAVQEMKSKAPTSPVDAIRLAVSSSDLFLKDIPAVTSSCVPKDSKDAFQTRDDIRKTFQVIIDQIFDSSSNGDKPLSKAEYALKLTDQGLDAVAMLDPTGIASMAKEFIQPICGPTSFLGEVDDGALDQALGLRTVGKAFAGSSGTWTKSGDGILKIIFESTDKKDVKVNIMSGGNKITEVSVKKGKTVEWTKPLADIKDKTMYMDRWRPGLFGLPGTGGGSLLLWVPHTSKGGHLELHAKINVS
ncbi:hypothetical protein Gpo141_00007272 [Globisporangium polare]